MKKTGPDTPSAPDNEELPIGDPSAESVERTRLQADVSAQRVRLAKDELRRARKRLKEAKRDARRARREASQARKAWKRSRRRDRRKGRDTSLTVVQSPKAVPQRAKIPKRRDKAAKGGKRGGKSPARSMRRKRKRAGGNTSGA